MLVPRQGYCYTATAPPLPSAPTDGDDDHDPDHGQCGR